MSTTSQLSEALKNAFENPMRSVLGLVDDLLQLSSEHGLDVQWQGGRCRFRFPGNGTEEAIEIPLPKSVFRAMLARIATLCNERCPNSVSLYGGHGELSVPSDPSAILKVVFTNTPAEQQLELIPDRRQD